jgi:ABC-type nitrate/sulfonate/bicarbonate transport system ATPase subunit
MSRVKPYQYSILLFGLLHQMMRRTLRLRQLPNRRALAPICVLGFLYWLVAIARALVRKPSLLLLDEPFSALDALTLIRLQDHLMELFVKHSLTMFFVTHDIEEAVALSDTIVVINGRSGQIHQQFRIDLPRPRSRQDSAFLDWKERVLAAPTE